ncbi:Ubiquitin domain-containing protein 2 [Smittium mucronatum]|uniref:Ubiquitin domain-containing protein 2 n=1 Tax=Smittium mucronatum TaxID=133383 RepID=A0A1R0H683_9FUNG|nr:Ubiquitin domain-containing protein 2 [Smittium mucronatum]
MPIFLHLVDLGRNAVWSADHPITMAELKEKREIFWETAPAYGGHQEIWQALRQVVESTDESLSQAILAGANIIVPSKKLIEGCFDEFGSKYLIPDYCLSLPRNLVDDPPSSQDQTHQNASSRSVHQDPSDASIPNKAENETANSSDSHKNPSGLMSASDPSASITNSGVGAAHSSIPATHNPDTESDQNLPVKIRIRLSTGQDIPFEISRFDTPDSVKLKLFEDLELDSSKNKVTFLFQGKIVEHNTFLINDLKLHTNSVLQAMISEISHNFLHIHLLPSPAQ